MTDAAPELPEELEAAVYEAILDERPVGPGTSEPPALVALRAQHPEHEAAILRLAARVGAGARATGFDFGAPAPPPVPARIGPFTLGDELGRGGFGVVYRAEQDPPLSRTVALKVLAPGLDAAGVHARFELERQLLARLTHPHIAEIHDAGTTAEGRPWFAMELIDGPPITTWCAEHSPDGDAILELFLDACDAVQHAHQRGVIHRDLKPSNVLVATVGGRPMAKVIDFGVAKALDQPLLGAPEETTLAGAIIGTPEYMSPEQGLGEPADVRSDVYSLGALLYRLLTDETPRDLTTLRERGFEAFRRELTDSDPERPSRRAETSAPQRASRIRGDLDWICLKALHREPDSRYASVAEFATDLRLHLEGRPITARPPSFGYLLATTWRRHKARLVLAGAGVALLAAASIVSTLSWLEARRQEDLANQRATQLDDAYSELQRTTDPLLARERAEFAERTLWPALPARLPAFDAWLEDVGPLADRLATTAPDEPARADLDHQIEAVAARRDTARAIGAQADAAADAWQAAQQAVASDPRFAGFVLETVPGLVPLGPDPGSGLQEFAHLLSGQPPERDAEGRLRTEEDSSIVLVLVPGGTTRIGAQAEDPDAPHHDPDSGDLERPVHEVRLDPFLIAKCEVTQAQWLRLDGARNPSRWHDRIKMGGIEQSLLHPVEQVSWRDATRILERHDLALPTEVAWEHAARAGTDAPWLDARTIGELAGRDNLADRSYGQRSPAGTSYETELDDGYTVHSPVGSFAPNRFGLHDLLGNVYEWTSGRMFEYDVPASPGRGERSAEKIRSSEHDHRVFRGGAYSATALIGRVSRRSSAPEDARSATIGVRPVRWLVPAPE